MLTKKYTLHYSNVFSIKCFLLEYFNSSCPKDMHISFNAITGDTSVSIVTDHGAGWPGFDSWQEKYFFTLHSIQTGSGAHPASSPMGTRIPTPGLKQQCMKPRICLYLTLMSILVEPDPHSLIHLHLFIYLAFIIVTTITPEQVTSLNRSFLRSFCPNA
jgi:hypothetical protein